jgi:hypothetical protein
MGRITAEIAPKTDHPTLDSITQRNTTASLADLPPTSGGGGGGRKEEEESDLIILKRVI